VGMCSHLPTPPPNKLVRVRLLDDPQSQSVYVPVQVTGQLRAEESDATIYILDGEARMLSGWTLYANTVERREDLGGNGAVDVSEKTVTNGAER